MDATFAALHQTKMHSTIQIHNDFRNVQSNLFYESSTNVKISATLFMVALNIFMSVLSLNLLR